ncbi:MAG: hypothetical protein ACX932_06035, partial [Gammaproteobacteria bacterium]
MIFDDDDAYGASIDVALGDDDAYEASIDVALGDDDAFESSIDIALDDDERLCTSAGYGYLKTGVNISLPVV